MNEEDKKELFKAAWRFYVSEVWGETSELLDFDETADEKSLGYEAGSRATRFAASAIQGLNDFEEGSAGGQKA